MLTPLSSGLRVGSYRLVHPLGSGGMAEVWLAERHPCLVPRAVAIKFIKRSLARTPRHVRLFAREIAAWKELVHPNVVTMREHGRQGGRDFLVLELIDGLDLERLRPTLAKLDPQFRLQVAAHVLAELLRALQYAHDLTDVHGRLRGLLHRDVTPRNVLVSTAGEVKLTDFGMARRFSEHTSGAFVKGTLRYLAPEQLERGGASPRVDLFGAGAIFQELATGRRFRDDAEDDIAIHRSIRDGAVGPCRPLPHPELEELRRTMLAPSPVSRLPSARAGLERLERIAGLRNMRRALGLLCERALAVSGPRATRVGTASCGAGFGTYVPPQGTEPAEPVEPRRERTQTRPLPAAPWARCSSSRAKTRIRARARPQTDEDPSFEEAVTRVRKIRSR